MHSVSFTVHGPIYTVLSRCRCLRIISLTAPSLSVRQLLLVALQSGPEPDACSDFALPLHAFSSLLLPGA